MTIHASAGLARRTPRALFFVLVGLVGCGGGGGGGGSTEGSSTGLSAFRGAQGFGSATRGGRGGAVIEVTNLDDSGAGSLRDAVETSGPRTVVFRVAGTITQTTPLSIAEPYLTIAGQTAPGGGITITGEEVRVQTHDVIIRHLRIRTGDVVVPVDGWDNRDCINFGTGKDLRGTHDVVLDHCSLSWSVDETLTTWYQSHDITVQNCIVSEALMYSKHPEGPHSMAVLISDGSSNISLHDNLIAHCHGRNPQVAYCGIVDIRNNVVYDWGDCAAQIKSPGQRVNFVGNDYRIGPYAATHWTPTAMRFHTDVAGLGLFIDGNVDPSCPTGLEDNWAMVEWDDGTPVTDTTMRVMKEWPHVDVTTLDVTAAYDSVLAHAGATKPERDAIDVRIVNDVVNGTGAIIDSPTDVGGWITMRPGTPPVDSDHDGIPDAWELSHGLDPMDATDGALDRDGDGYTNLEEYLEELAAE